MIRWGMIGCGSVTEVKSGPALQRAAGSALVAVMRRDGEKARDYAARHGVAKWGTDAQALIHDPEVDAVYIATPPAFHADYAVQVAQAGKPVYVEKPMGCTVAECRRMLAACEQAGVPLFVAYYRRALPRFLQVKALLEAEALGEVRAVIVRLIRPLQGSDADAGNWRVDPALAGGGYFYDVGSHMLDLLDFLFGPIVTARGTAANQAGRYAAEDVVAGHFTFANGVQGIGLWSFASYNTGIFDQVEIVGTRGRLSYSTFGEMPILLETAQGITPFDIPNPPHIQQPLIQTIVDELHGAGHCPSRGDSAQRTNWVMEELVRGFSPG